MPYAIAIVFLFSSKLFFSSFSSFWLGSLDPIKPKKNYPEFFFVIFVKLVVSVSFLGAFGRFHVSRKHSSILCYVCQFR